MENNKIKSWLITTAAPFCGTDQYYTVFSEEDPLEIDEINEWFWDEETENLWDAYSYLSDSEFNAELEEWEGDEDEFWEKKHQEWKEECTIDAEEVSLEELAEYGTEDDLPEIIYDERRNDKIK